MSNRRTHRALTALAGWLLVWGPAALARAQEVVPPPTGGEELGSAFSKMLMALALVLMVLAGLYWLARRFLPSQAAGPSGGMKVLGRLALGPRKGVVLVEVAGRVLVLGMSEQGLNLLTTLEDPAQVGRLAQGRGSFGRLLKRAAKGKDEETA